jgi:hypothetical protein
MPMNLSLTVLMAVLVLAVASKAGAREGYAASVYYYPMGSTSYVDIDSKKIEKQYDVTSIVKNDLAEILRIIDKHKQPAGSFEDTLVRLKIVPATGETIVVNMRRQVRIGKKFFTIDRESYRLIQRRILESAPDG